MCLRVESHPVLNVLRLLYKVTKHFNIQSVNKYEINGTPQIISRK